MNNNIAEIKNVDVRKLKNECPLDKWYIDILNKPICDLNILDLSRMIRHEVYPDIAIPLAWDILQKNPFEGEMYDGQLLEILTKYIEDHFDDKYYNKYLEFRNQLYSVLCKYEGNLQEDKVEFKK